MFPLENLGFEALQRKRGKKVIEDLEEKFKSYKNEGDGAITQV